MYILYIYIYIYVYKKEESPNPVEFPKMFDLWSPFSFFRLRGAEFDLMEANVPRGGEIRSND